jgi:hypothetical protein
MAEGPDDGSLERDRNASPIARSETSFNLERIDGAPKIAEQSLPLTFTKISPKRQRH